jgi:WD40 repeat protein
MGHLHLYENFIESLSDDADYENIVTCHWTSKDIKICNMSIIDTVLKRISLFQQAPSSSTLSTSVMGVYCLCLYKMTKIILGTADKLIKILDLVTGDIEQTLSGHTREVLCLKLLESTNTNTKCLLASGSWDNLIKIWDLSLNGQCLFTLNSQIEHSIYCLEQLQNKEYLLAGSGDNLIRIWNLKTKLCVSTLVGHTNDVKCLRVLTNMKNLFASGSADGTIRIWNWNIEECVQVLKGHTGKVFSVDVTWSHDMVTKFNFLISCSSDRTIRVWNMSNQFECVYLLCEHTEPVYCVRVNTAGHLLSSSADKCIKKWSLSTGECLKTLKLDTVVWKFDLCSMF